MPCVTLQIRKVWKWQTRAIRPSKETGQNLYLFCCVFFFLQFYRVEQPNKYKEINGKCAMKRLSHCSHLIPFRKSLFFAMVVVVSTVLAFIKWWNTSDTSNNGSQQLKRTIKNNEKRNKHQTHKVILSYIVWIFVLFRSIKYARNTRDTETAFIFNGTTIQYKQYEPVNTRQQHTHVIFHTAYSSIGYTHTLIII